MLLKGGSLWAGMTAVKGLTMSTAKQIEKDPMDFRLQPHVSKNHLIKKLAVCSFAINRSPYPDITPLVPRKLTPGRVHLQEVCSKVFGVDPR